MMKVKNKIPLMLGLTILLVVVIKLFLPAPHQNIELKNEFWLHKTHSKEQFEIVVGGDSRTYRGVSIHSIENEIGEQLKGVNLGYSSGGFSQEYIQVMKSRLKTDGPQFMVFGLSPHSFTLDATQNLFYHQYKAFSRFDLFKGLYLAKYLKHFAPYKISELRDYYNGTEESRYYETFEKTGWVRSYRLPEDTIQALKSYEKLFNTYQINDSLVSDFFKCMDTLVEEGIQIIAFRPPTFDGMSNLEDSLSGYNENDMRTAIEKRGGHWITLENADFHTYDGSHLHYESAELLGRLIGEKIQKIRSEIKNE